MADIGVLDTGVLVGFTIKNDQHHETAKEYIIDEGPDTLFLTPTGNREFSNTEPFVRKKLHEEIRDHRVNVQNEVRDSHLSDSHFQMIRDGILDQDETPRAHAFLYRWYTKQIKESNTMPKTQLVQRLSNMETEPFQDMSQNYGGWKSHVDIWNKGVDNYPGVKGSLLVSHTPDQTIILEAHHVASDSNTKDVEFATANPQDFVYKRDTEPVSRKRNILQNSTSHVDKEVIELGHDLVDGAVAVLSNPGDEIEDGFLKRVLPFGPQ